MKILTHQELKANKLMKMKKSQIPYQPFNYPQILDLKRKEVQLKSPLDD